MGFANRYFLELYIIITISKLICIFPGHMNIHIWSTGIMLKLSLPNSREILYWRNNGGRGVATLVKKNEFLISTEPDFCINNISDICFALLHYSRKVICFMNSFSLCLLKYLLFIVGELPHGFCNLFCLQILNLTSFLHLRKWHRLHLTAQTRHMEVIFICSTYLHLPQINPSMCSNFIS